MMVVMGFSLCRFIESEDGFSTIQAGEVHGV
jgi:hypothetical protein